MIVQWNRQKIGCCFHARCKEQSVFELTAYNAPIQAQRTLQEAIDKLEGKKKELQDVLDKLKKLEDSLAASKQQQEDLVLWESALIFQGSGLHEREFHRVCIRLVLIQPAASTLYVVSEDVTHP